MNWSLRKKKEAIFVPFILSEVIFLIFVFYLNVQCIEYTFRTYLLLHVKKPYFVHFCCLLLKSSKASSVSLRHIYQQVFLRFNRGLILWSKRNNMQHSFLSYLNDTLHPLQKSGSQRMLMILYFIITKIFKRQISQQMRNFFSSVGRFLENKLSNHFSKDNKKSMFFNVHCETQNKELYQFRMRVKPQSNKTLWNI